jgi:hypothetical protein
MIFYRRRWKIIQDLPEVAEKWSPGAPNDHYRLLGRTVSARIGRAGRR